MQIKGIEEILRLNSMYNDLTMLKSHIHTNKQYRKECIKAIIIPLLFYIILGCFSLQWNYVRQCVSIVIKFNLNDTLGWFHCALLSVVIFLYLPLLLSKLFVKVFNIQFPETEKQEKRDEIIGILHPYKLYFALADELSKYNEISSELPEYTYERGNASLIVSFLYKRGAGKEKSTYTFSKYSEESAPFIDKVVKDGCFDFSVISNHILRKLHAHDIELSEVYTENEEKEVIDNVHTDK